MCPVAKSTEEASMQGERVRSEQEGVPADLRPRRPLKDSQVTGSH